jgi:thioredoxin reductase (NADPH)
MVERALKNPKIQVIWNSEVTEVVGDGRSMTGIVLKNAQDQSTKKMDLQGLFIAIGHKPNTDLFRGILELHESGYLRTKPGTTQTNIQGVFAAGDVQDSYYRQAVTAAGTGCMAAIEVERWLEANESH